jgi:acyl-CoA synthetase (AMP-forming)/AMP-acid ligase II
MLMNGSNTLYETLIKWTKTKGERISIIDLDTDKKITYRELFFAITAFQEFFGSKPQTIILATQGSILNSIIWLTSLIFGHQLLPISSNTTEFEYKELLTKHKPSLLISETETWVTNPGTKRLTRSQCEEIIKKSEKNKTINDHDTKTIDGTIYLETSGSTGKPKGMMLTATQIVMTAKNIAERHELTENDRGFTPLPFYHVNAPVVSMVTSILTGGTVIIAPKFSASNFWNWVEKYNPTWISIVPTIVAILLKFDKPEFLDKSSIRFVRTASAPLPRANLAKFEAKFGLPVIETYGISEGASTIASNPLSPKEHKPGSVGLPLNLHMEILDPKTYRKTKQGEIGEVWVKGDQIINHYEDGRDEEAFIDGGFMTGDLGYFDEEGYLFLTGRKKEVIIRGGENIIPREIEEILLTYPGVIEAAVVGQHDSILGEKVVAFLVTEEDTEESVNEKIKKFLSTKLSRQKVPAEIYILPELPKGKTNKIDKNVLKELHPM